MTQASVRFELGEAMWIAERDSVEFPGLTELGPVEFLITRDALSYLLSPDLDEIDSDTAVETFFEFENHIHRIARLEFVKRLGGEPPILLTIADLESAGRPEREPEDDQFEDEDHL